jgi:ABC-type sugar transport system substrate-binding protein
MSTRSRWLKLLLGSAVVALAALAVFAPAASAKRSSTTGKFWTTKEVDARLPLSHIQLLWNVPKVLPKHYTLGFVNWNATFPFFATWASGMEAAAHLFHVGFYQADAKWDTTQFVNLFNGMEVHHLDAVGFGATSSEALVQAATQAGVLSMSIDASTPGAYGIGVDSPAVGKLAGNFLGPVLKQKLAGPWKGSKVMFLVINTAGCATCIARTNTEQATIRKYAGISASASILSPANDTATEQFVADTITAHPGWKFVIGAVDDEDQAAAIPALQAAGQMSNTLIVSLGGDSVGRDLVRKYPKTVIGAIDFNPYAEGFNWVVACIAALNHKHFAQYPVNTLLTASNVNKYYPNDPKP